MSFLKELKISVINKDLEKLKELSDKNVEFNSVEEANEILQYLIEAKKILENEKKELKKGMQEIKKLKKFNKENDKSSISFKI